MPEIIDEERTEDDEFLVVACDGLWDVLENEGVLEFIATRFELMPLDQIAQVRSLSLSLLAFARSV